MIYDMNVGEGDLSDLMVTVAETVDDLDKHAKDFDIIAVRGLSGQLVGIPASLALQKNLIVVRKNDIEYAHSDIHPGMRGAPQNGRYIIIDDFSSTGDTKRRIITEIGKIRPDLRYIGDYWYEDFGGRQHGYYPAF